jgi:hypothetical protein
MTTVATVAASGVSGDVAAGREIRTAGPGCPVPAALLRNLAVDEHHECHTAGNETSDKQHHEDGGDHPQKVTPGIALPLRVCNVRRRDRYHRVFTAVAALELPPPVFKTCPWQPRELVETGLRQWLRCCAPALRDKQVIGMPSHAVDEAWHGLILCTARYSAFCEKAYGEFLHHHPDGGAPKGVSGVSDPVDEQLRRTVLAWTLVSRPGERCVLWDLDEQVGVDQPWGLPKARVAEIEAAATRP